MQYEMADAIRVPTRYIRLTIKIKKTRLSVLPEGLNACPSRSEFSLGFHRGQEC